MALIKLLDEFTGAIATAMSDAPDSYLEWRGKNAYEDQKADILDLWSQIHPKIKKDIAQAAFIDQKVKEAFSAFDEEGDKAKGRQALCDIYNAEPKKLR